MRAMHRTLDLTWCTRHNPWILASLSSLQCPLLFIPFPLSLKILLIMHIAVNGTLIKKKKKKLLRQQRKAASIVIFINPACFIFILIFFSLNYRSFQHFHYLYLNFFFLSVLFKAVVFKKYKRQHYSCTFYINKYS